MKKLLFIIILSLLLALTACDIADNSPLETTSSTENTAVQTNPTVMPTKEPTTPTAETTLNPLTPTVATAAPATPQPTKQAVYTHVALEGCVIVDTDGAMITYKKKCEKCGKVQPGTVTIGNQSSGTLTTSFICIYCGNQQDIKIQNSTEYN